MITFPLPQVDAALVVAMVVLFCALLAAALWVRPELRDGKKLDRMRSYAIGAGALLGSILLLATYRGIVCQCAAVQVPQLWLDAIGLSFAAALATWIHRKAFGEPRRGNPHRDLQQYAQEAQKLTNGITDD